MAAALDEKVIEPETKFINLPKSSCSGFPIREYDNEIPTDLVNNFNKVRKYRISKDWSKVGQEKFKLFLSKLGILEKLISILKK